MTDSQPQPLPDLSLHSPTISSASSSSSSPSGIPRAGAKRPYVESMEVDQDVTVRPGSPQPSSQQTDDRQHKRARSNSSNPPNLAARRDSDDARSFVTASESPNRTSLPSSSAAPAPHHQSSGSTSGSGMEVIDADEIEEDDDEEDEDIVVVASPQPVEQTLIPVPPTISMDHIRSPTRIDSSPIAPPPRPPNPLPIPPRTVSYSSRLFSPPPTLSLTLPTPSATHGSTTETPTPLTPSFFPSQAQTRRFSEAIEPLRHSPPPIQSPRPPTTNTNRLRELLLDTRRNGLSSRPPGPSLHRLSSFSEIPEPSILAGPLSDISSSDEEDELEVPDWSHLERFRQSALDDVAFATRVGAAQRASRVPTIRNGALDGLMREYNQARRNLRAALGGGSVTQEEADGVREMIGRREPRTARRHSARWPMIDREMARLESEIDVDANPGSRNAGNAPNSNTSSGPETRRELFGLGRPPSISLNAPRTSWDHDGDHDPTPASASREELLAPPRLRQAPAISAAFRNRLSSILEDRARPVPSSTRRINRPSSLAELHSNAVAPHRLTDSPMSMFRQLDSQRPSTSSGSGSGSAGTAGTGASTPSHRSSLVLPPSWHAPSPQSMANPLWPPTPSGSGGGWGSAASGPFAVPPSPRSQDPLGLDAWGGGGGEDAWSPLTPSWPLPLPGAPRMMPRNFSTTDLNQIRTGYTPQSSRSNSLIPGYQSPAPSLYAFMSPPGSMRGLPDQRQQSIGVERSPLRTELDLGWESSRRAWTEDMPTLSQTQQRSRPATLLHRSGSHPIPSPAMDFIDIDGDEPGLADEIRRQQQAYARVRRRQSMLRGSQEFGIGTTTHTIAEEDQSEGETPNQRRRVVSTGFTTAPTSSSPPSNLLFEQSPHEPEETMVQRMNRMMAMRRESTGRIGSGPPTPVTPGGMPSRTPRIPRAPLNVDGASASFTRTTQAERDSSPSPTRVPRLGQARMTTGGRPPARMERQRVRDDHDREMLGLDISALQEHVREERLLRRRSSNFESRTYRPPSGFGFERDSIDIGFFESWGLSGPTPPVGGLPPSQIAQLPTGVYSECEEAKKEERCPICLEDYKDADSVMGVTDCNHYFHKDCLTQWLQTKRSCPYCRQNITRARGRRPGGSYSAAFGPGPGPGSASGSMFSL